MENRKLKLLLYGVLFSLMAAAAQAQLAGFNVSLHSERHSLVHHEVILNITNDGLLDSSYPAMLTIEQVTANNPFSLDFLTIFIN